ncbi:MAG: hypothetical protein ABIQ64_01035 [Candidatus Saccharimonadales bacterium]
MNPQQPEQPAWNQPSAAQPVDEQPEQFSEQDEEQQGEPIPVITWEASESIHHEKDRLWFMAILAGGAILALISIFLIQSITFTILIVVMVIALFVLAKRPPRVLRYQLDDRGITINEKSYSFHDFKAFGVVQDGPFYYVSLIPLKRFMPGIDVYFPEEYGEDIVDILGEFIPMKTIEHDFLDKITKQLRF